jgi:hypothetical protein
MLISIYDEAADEDYIRSIEKVISLIEKELEVHSLGYYGVRSYHVLPHRIFGIPFHSLGQRVRHSSYCGNRICAESCGSINISNNRPILQD